MNGIRAKQILENALSYVSREPERAAEILLERYGSISNVAMADLDELASISYVGEKGAYFLRIAFSLASRRGSDGFKFGKKHTEEEILSYLKSLFLSCTNENVYYMLFDKDMKAISCEFASEGTVNSTDILPRKILEVAIKKNATNIIIAHNHPLGQANASFEDIDTTYRIASLFESTGRTLVCHYVISGNEHYRIDVDEEDVCVK